MRNLIHNLMLKHLFRDEKHIDFVEQLESVAYCRCGDDPISVEQFIQIFYTKGVSNTYGDYS